MGGKFKWYLILLIDLVLFLGNLMWQQVLVNLIVIGVALIVYRFGSPVLFKEYEERRQGKLKESQAIREAASTVLNSGQLFKRDGGKNQ